jgi:hypothetical protein
VVGAYDPVRWVLESKDIPHRRTTPDRPDIMNGRAIIYGIACGEFPYFIGCRLVAAHGLIAQQCVCVTDGHGLCVSMVTRTRNVSGLPSSATQPPSTSLLHAGKGRSLVLTPLVLAAAKEVVRRSSPPRKSRPSAPYSRAQISRFAKSRPASE